MRKSFGEFGTKVTPDQLSLAQSRIDQIHAHFKAAIGAGRRMTAGQVRASLGRPRVSLGRRGARSD